MSLANIVRLIKETYNGIRSNDVAGFLVISIGLIVGTPSANLDMANHWLSKPETFFSPSHGGVYTGVAIVIFGSIWVLKNAYRQQTKHEKDADHRGKTYTHEYYKPHRWFFNEDIPLSVKLVFYGVIITTLAGPFDFAWHTVFGLDGLLSPSHATFRIGEALCAIGALLGIISTHPVMSSAKRSMQYYSLYPVFIIIAILPVVFAARGFISMVTLPFSNTYSFQWNPDPLVAAIIATIGYPFFISLILYLSFRVGNFNAISTLGDAGSKSLVTRHRFKFGILTTTGIGLVAASVSGFFPNIFLQPTIPLYVLNIIPIVSADILLTIVYVNTSYSNLYGRRIIEIVVGAILGLTFFTLQYPFITYTYNVVLENPEIIGPTNVHMVYLKTLSVLPFITIPSILFGILGVIVGRNLLSHYTPQLVKSN